MAVPKGVFEIKGRRGESYWYFQQDRGKPSKGPLIRLPGGPTGLEFWAAYQKAAGVIQAPPGAVKAIIVEYKASPLWHRLRPASQKLYTIALRRIEECFGEIAASQVTPAALAAFRDVLAPKAATANVTLAIAQELFRFAAERGHISGNPVREVRRIEFEPDGAKPIPEAVYRHVLATAPEIIRRMFILGRATAQRISDLVQMRPLDRDGAGIKITITKRRKNREHWIPLDQTAIAEIDGWNSPVMAPYLMRESKRHSTTTLRHAWNVYRESEIGRPARAYTPHDLRATAVCDDRVAGMAHQTISARRGMSVEMVMQYTKHIDQRLAAETSQNEHGTKLQSGDKKPAKQKRQASDNKTK